ncbi:hypothetical protein Q2T41_13075 [Maribacter confluentis]|uniref:DUF1735 domain-containing protein n=1 Tax=Maribacter confluentis TaxID=1656093 RepID=A0ABT8RRP7_9FLAO|nr:hypothetical protein [Maribacter confluentis]MDO1513588.1 hypothetical protein [Maribacter confluentis]
MMKINYKVFAACMLTSLMFTSCDEGDAVVDDVVANTTRGAILRTIEVKSDELPIGVDTGEFSVDLEIQSEADGTLVDALEVYVSFLDADPSNGPGDVAESLLTTIPSSEFGVGDRGLPTYSFSATLGELLGVTGITASDIDGSDQFRIRFALILNDGRSFSFAQNSGTLTGSYFSSPFLYSATVVCPPKAPTPGVWTINMTDSYGDGWQTSTGLGGDGITVTLDDGTVLEVGLCSPYAGAAGTFLGGTDCVPNDGSAGVGTITIPEGTLTADWYFPGDEYGEIGFEIVTPNGNIVGGYQSADAGPITIDFCKD